MQKLVYIFESLLFELQVVHMKGAVIISVVPDTFSLEIILLPVFS